MRASSMVQHLISIAPGRRCTSLIADALATYLIGPAYAHALVFLVLNPTDPFIEGERASMGTGRSRFLPSDARRAAIVFDVLKRMSAKTKPDQHTDGIYDPELRLLETVWERALEASGVLKQYQDLNLDLAGSGRIDLRDPGAELQFSIA